MFEHLMFITVLYTTGSALTVEPQNVFINQKEKFKMVCCSDGETLFWNYFNKEDSKSLIFNGEAMAPVYKSRGFRVELNGTCSSLIHDEILFEYSGIYGCKGGSASFDSTAHLVILQTEGLNCGIKDCKKHAAEKTFNISIQCSTIFSGLLEPVINCKNGETELSKEIIQDDFSGMEKTVKNNFTMPFQGGSKNVSVICEIFYKITDEDQLMAKNWKNSWSKKIDVSKQCVGDSPSRIETKWIILIVLGIIVGLVLLVVLVALLIYRKFKAEKSPKKSSPSNSDKGLLSSDRTKEQNENA